jgi:regulator of protease activity HflC (stomatin/prohibitin superfamily)
VTANNEAQKYYNTVTEGAKGQAQQITKDAEAYKEQKIALATGDAQRFLSVYNQYKLSKEITQRRIYLETMETIMQKMRKILIEPSAGTVPYLPLDQLLRQAPGTAPGSPEDAEHRGGQPMNRFSGAAILIAIVVGIIVLLQSIFTVHQADRAIVLRFGEPVRKADEPDSTSRCRSSKT